MISWLTSDGGWGTREQAIPGEWAALVLIMVLGAALGLLVLWFTVLRHERTVRRRASRRPRAVAMSSMVSLAGIGPAADEKAPSEPESEAYPEPEPAAVEEDAEQPEATEEETSEQPAEPSATTAKRKLTDEILSRVESELAERETPRWKDLAALVHREYGVTVHPSSIQKAVKRRRLADATDPAPA